MSLITPNMSLNVWNSLTDKYDHAQLASNFIALDQHDHSPGRGAQINGATGIKDYSIPGSKMASDFGLSFAADTIPGTAIQTAATGTGINGPQIEPFGVWYSKLGATPYCELYRTGGALTTATYDVTLASYTSVTENISTINSATSSSLGTMGSTTAGTITAPLNGIYSVQALFEFNYPNGSFPITSSGNYFAIKNSAASDAVARTQFPTYNYVAATTNSPVSGTACGLFKAAAGSTFSLTYRVPSGTTSLNIAYLRVSWISSYDNT